MKPAYILAAIVLAVSLVVTLFSFTGAIAHHVNIQQAMERPGEVVQVPGAIVKESVTYDAIKGQLRFDIVGLDAKTGQPDPTMRMTVVYPQPKPENFDTATKVEAIGKYENGVFRAQSLLVKCPSKYQDEPATQAGQGSKVDSRE